jgi:TonB family protein
MMIALFLAIALQATPAAAPVRPVPANDPATWVSINDYPREALEKHQEGAVGFSLEVGPAGYVQSCRITQSSGAPTLDAATCALVFVRARFDPVRESATPTSIYASRIRWSYPAKIEDPARSQAAVELRGRIRDGEGASILYVDANGVITQCDEGPRPYDNVLAGPDLCAIFPVGSRYGAPTLFNGKPVKRKVTLKLSVHDVNLQ